MGKGDKQRSNREAKKPKADKKIVSPAGSISKKPEPPKPTVKPSSR